jgi:uncharacterized protein (TIGR00730 family)
MNGIVEDREYHDCDSTMMMTEDEFLQQGEAKEPLRICCYGSSSNLTPQKYLDQAYALGKLLAQRGHVCVNGAGAWGCMGALNQGASDHDGHIIGVIHGMFEVDGAIWSSEEGKTTSDSPHNDATNDSKDAGSHAAFQKNHKRELLIASGDDLQERKKMLVQHADALVVLPGGPGTWDELLEMACAKNVGLSDIPIVCVNVDGYYEPLRQMFQSGQDQQMVKIATEDILSFVPSALDALRYMEQQLEGKSSKCPTIQRRKSAFMQSQGRGSMMGDGFGFVKSFLGHAETGSGGLYESNGGTSRSNNA